jgi:transposase
VAAGYVVYAINPIQAARYRERHTSSGAKSDPGDAHVLAEIIRTDRDHHRPVAGDSERAEVVKTLARTHQTMIWTRQRQTNQLRSMLREFYPAALAAFSGDLAGRDAIAVLAIAPTPTLGQSLTKPRIVAVLRRAGRQRNLERRAEQILTALRTEQLGLSEALTEAYGVSVRSLVAVIITMADQVQSLEAEVERCFGQHPDAEIITSQPDSVSSSAPGCSPSSETPPTASPTPKPAATTPEPAPSPKPPAPGRSCSPGSPATGAWPTPCTSRPSPH